jgi:hypothetical protein
MDLHRISEDAKTSLIMSVAPQFLVIYKQRLLGSLTMADPPPITPASPTPTVCNAPQQATVGAEDTPP